MRGNVFLYQIGELFRTSVKFNFPYQVCWIRFIGTHAEYDKIDANTI